MPDSLTVGDLMTTQVVSIGMDETLRQAQQVFNHKKFHHLVVLEAGKPVGVISDRDLLKHLSPFIGARFSERPQDIATLDKRIHQIMTRKLIYTTPEATIRRAAHEMFTHNVSCLPVLDEGRLVGIVTLRDLAKRLVQDQFKQ